jgi:hypothetical protein
MKAPPKKTGAILGRREIALDRGGRLEVSRCAISPRSGEGGMGHCGSTAWVHRSPSQARAPSKLYPKSWPDPVASALARARDPLPKPDRERAKWGGRSAACNPFPLTLPPGRGARGLSQGAFTRTIRA